MKRNGNILVIFILWAVVVIGIGTILTLWTDRNLDYALTWIKGQPVNCPMWLSFIAALIGNGVTVVFNILMELARLVR